MFEQSCSYQFLRKLSSLNLRCEIFRFKNSKLNAWGWKGCMQGRECSDRQGLWEVSIDASEAKHRGTEKCFNTCSLLFTLQADESAEKNLPTFPKLLWSEVRKKKKSCAPRKKEKNREGEKRGEKREVNTMVERDRNIKSEWMLPFSQWGEILHHASFLRLKSLRLCDLKEGVANSEHKRIFKNARAKQPSVSSRPLRSVRGDLRGVVVEGGIEHLRGVSGVADRTHADRHSYSAEGVGVNFSNISALWDTFTQGQLFARGFQHENGYKGFRSWEKCVLIG